MREARALMSSDSECKTAQDKPVNGTTATVFRPISDS